MTTLKRGLCVFGGAFNPPHATHRRIVAAALAELKPDRLLVVPCGDHPQKPGLDLAPAEDRLAMCVLNFGGLDPRVEVSDIEVHRAGPSYSVDTLRKLSVTFGIGVRIWFLIGSDNLPLLTTWHDHHSLFELATIVTFPRAGHPIEEALADVDIRLKHKRGLLEAALHIEPDATSASSIRARLGRGERTPEVLPDVLGYICSHGLYGVPAG